MAKDVKTAPETQGLRKPLCFVENKGQVVDEYNHLRGDIQYKLSTPGMSMYVGDGQLKYQFKKIEGTTAADMKVTDYRMDVTLVGANKNALVAATEKQVYVENYYTSPASHNGFTAHAYNKITYKNVYNNIDWVLYVKDDKVEYDFVVRPGGNVNDIKIKYDGATALSLTKDGGISAETPLGKVEEKTPYSYETVTGRKVASKFVLNGNVVSFKTDAYKGSLTIDPALQWSTYFGADGEDVATSIQVNTSGVFVSGYSAKGTITIVTLNALPGVTSFHNANQGGTYDAYIAKYDATGNPLWHTFYGGTGNDQGMAIALDNASNSVYMTGFTTSTSTIVGGGIPGTFQTTKGALNDGFLIKFNSNTGTPTWATYFGGNGDDYCNGVACDQSGNVYITGKTNSTNVISHTVPSGATLSGGNDAFVAKFNSSGVIQWSQYFGGAADDQALAVACDNTNSVYITGTTGSVGGIATPGAYQISLNGFNDAFIAKFSTGGAPLWGTYFGGPNEETANAIAINSSNELVIVGNTSSPFGVASVNAYKTDYNSSILNTQDAFVAYFNQAGALSWSTYYGGENPDYGQGVCFDPFNNVVITGATFSNTGIYATNGSPQPAINGSYDAFITKMTPLGQVIWGTYFGGPTYDFANAVACNTTTDQISIAGFTAGVFTYNNGTGTGISTFGTEYPQSHGGTYDMFITTFKRDTFLTINQPFADTLVCAGGTLTVPFTVYPAGVSYLPGNIFVVQLSDNTGSFASPDTIGMGTASPIVCTIPTTTPGNHHRIRIVAFSPVFTSPDDFYNITITGPTTPAPSVAASTPVCLGNNLYFYTNSPNHISGYNWSGPNGFFSSLPDPVRLSVPYADSGTYTVITFHNGCPPDTSTVHVDINNFVAPTPTDSFSITCDGNTLYLFADNGIPGSSYSWTGPGGFASTDQNPVIPAATFTNTGTYTVIDTVGGCQSLPISEVVTVLPLMPTSSIITASPGFTSGEPGDTICLGTLVTFNAITVNGGFSPTYQWMSSGSPIVGAVASVYSSATLLDGQQIYCIVNSSLSCPLVRTSVSDTITMNVINNPPLVFINATPGGRVSPGTVVTFASAVYNGGIGALYQWKLNHVNVPGATSSTFTTVITNSNDTVTLTVASTMMCATPNTGSSNVVIVETNVGVSSVAEPLNNIALFPNPNTGTFTLKGNVIGINNSTVSLEIVNAIGQVLYTGNTTVQNDELNKTIDLQNIPEGIYLLRVNAGDQSKTFRFAIQH